jgi:Ca-activated chloride channel family protein
MRFLTLVCIFIIGQTLATKSENVKTQIRSDTAQINIIKILPDSFPNLSILFWAQDKWGYPVWGMKKSQVRVLENGSACAVNSLQQITEMKPINLVIIIDHSASMIAEDFSNLTTLDLILRSENLKRTSPLTNAKRALITFLNNFDKPKDLACIIGFSSTVDLITPFSNDKRLLTSQINNLEEEGQTALYDAISIGIDSLSNKDGINVIVALTDGDDNKSTNTAQDIIKKSKEYEVPIYLIGLGAIKKNILESISRSTKGVFYYTKKSTSLVDVYDDVARQIKSIYELRYVSGNNDQTLNKRDIVLEFDIDTLIVKQASINYDLPEEYIQRKIREEEDTRKYLAAAGIGLVVIVLGSVVYLKIRKNKLSV